MKAKRTYVLIALFLIISLQYLPAQNPILKLNAEDAMSKASRFMLEEISTNGGYLWYYMPDFSRQWGEMEAYKTMIWLQHPGTISMGHTFLNAYQATGDDYYYQAAQKAAAAMIWGQSHEGGWNYMIDFAGDRSLKHWYKTIGKNGWRLEEFQHYYGNSTFDDDVTSDAARLLLRIYLEKMDPAYKPALDKAINFILKSQYPLGGWPQRYPLRYDFSKHGQPDYTSFYTFNDDVTWENVHFLIQCYLTLGEERFLDPINRGMDFYLFSQDGSGAWAQQLTLDLEPAGARSYEPAAFLPGATFENAFLLLKFYQYTGDKRFLVRVPAAIEWLEKTALPPDQVEGARTHPTFVDPKTNKPIYVHRKGSNVKYGRYSFDENDTDLLAHYYGKTRVSIDELKEEYNRLARLPKEELVKDSPLKSVPFTESGTPQTFYDLTRTRFARVPDEVLVKEIIQSLDDQGRWLVKHAMITNPYQGDGVKTELTDQYASTMAGDETDTSPYRDESDQLYISTGEYIRNMNLLINYIQLFKGEQENP